MTHFLDILTLIYFIYLYKSLVPSVTSKRGQMSLIRARVRQKKPYGMCRSESGLGFLSVCLSSWSVSLSVSVFLSRWVFREEPSAFWEMTRSSNSDDPSFAESDSLCCTLRCDSRCQLCGDWDIYTMTSPETGLHD